MAADTSLVGKVNYLDGFIDDLLAVYLNNQVVDSLLSDLRVDVFCPLNTSTLKVGNCDNDQ